MGAGTTTAGKIKIGIALDPRAYELLQQMASGPRGLGSFLEDLIWAESARRGADCTSGSDVQQRYQNDVLCHIAEAVVTLDAERRIIGWNRAAQELFFWTPEEALGRHVDEVIPREPRGSTLAAVYQQLDTEGAWRGETLVHRRDGSVLPVEATGVVVRDGVGQVLYRIGVMRDITERAEAEAREAEADAEMRRLYEQAQLARQQLQTLSRRLVEVQEQERRALSRDLHDTSGQSITALKLGLGALLRGTDCSEKAHSRIDALLSTADAIAEDLHRLAVNLRPAALDRYGLVPALEQLLTEFRKQTGLKIDFQAVGVEGSPARLPADVETAFYRIVQESLTNIARYAKATSVSVTFRNEGAQAQMVVGDNGCGFDVEAALQSGRLGLLGMRERAGMFGGTLEIASASGQGTVVRATIPLEQAATGRPLPYLSGAAWSPASDTLAPDLPSPMDEAPANVAPANDAPDAGLAEAAELARAKVLSDALIEITAGMAGCANANEILELVLTRSAQAMGREAALIAMREDRAWWVRYRYPEAGPHERISDAEAPGWVRTERTRQVLVVDDTSAEELDAALRSAAYGLRSYACIPLLAGERFLAILSFVSYSAVTPFHPSEVEFLHRLARLVSLALENALLRQAEAGQREELVRRVEELQAVSERLREAEAEARDLIRYAPSAIYEIDFRTGRFVSVNDAMCDMLGYSREELLGMSAFDIMDEANRARLAERQRLALAGEDVDPSFEYEVRRKDGRAVYGALKSRVIYRDGLPVSAHVIAHDVTERRRAADEQRAQQERLARLAAEQAAVLDAIADGLVIYDELGQITRMNRAAEHILAFSLGDRRPSAGEVAGRLDARLPDGRPYPPARYPVKRALRGETVQSDVMVLRRRDATVRIALSAAPILGPDGRPRGAVATFTDITSLHETQEHLEETYLKLEAAHQELQAQTEELAHANAGLAEERDRLQALEKELRGRREQSEQLAAELDAILSAIADGLVVYDSQGRITRMNALAEDVLGFNPEMRKLPYDRRVPSAAVGLHADGTPYAPHEYPTVRALHGEVVRHQELIMQLPGRPVEASWVSVSSGPIRREDRSISGAVTTFTDVSRLHRLNEQLSRANTDLEAILAAVPSGLIVYDAAGKTLRASHAARQMVGWSSDSWQRPASERAGANVRFLDLNGQYLPRDRYPALRALRGESLSGEEYYVHFPDGPEHDLWAVFSASPISTAQGQIVGALITWADTGKLHEANLQLSQANAQLEVRAEQLRQAGDFLEERVRQRTAALQESEQKFLTAFNLNPTALAISTMEGRYVEVNQTLCDLLGYSREELIGKTSRELGIVAPPTHRNTLATIGSADGRQPYEVDARARDGRTLNFMCYVQTVSLQGVPHYIVANVDITERKRAEALIAAHAERLAEQAELLDLSHDGIFVRGIDGVIQFWNRGAAEMYGWGPDEATGRISHELLRTVFPQPVDEIMAEVIERDRWEGELRHTTKDNALLWVASRWALKRDERGQPAAILEINNDITGEKSAEAQRAAAQQAILQQSQRLELLHEQLQASHAQLAQREAMLTTLSRRLVERQESERSYVADRLYNEAAQVIAALKMQVGVMERSAKQEPAAPQRLHDLADMMDRALLELHRLATDLRPATLDRLGLAAAVQQYAADFASRHALAVQVEARDLKGVRLPADIETCAYRVLQEALTNAAQHAHASQVAIALNRGAGRLRLQVTDDGIGFDVHEAEARGSVGLVGMRERAEAVRGGLTIDSAPGSGTKVTLEIPEPSAARQP